MEDGTLGHHRNKQVQKGQLPLHYLVEGMDMATQCGNFPGTPEQFFSNDFPDVTNT